MGLRTYQDNRDSKIIEKNLAIEVMPLIELLRIFKLGKLDKP